MDESKILIHTPRDECTEVEIVLQLSEMEIDTNTDNTLHAMKPSNAGIPLDLGWISSVAVNLPAVNRRASTLGTKRTVKVQYQAAWLLRAVTCIDLTTLSGDDTAANVHRLCLKGARPIRDD